MRRLKFLFRPGWLALAAVVALFAFLCFTVLAPWQLGKNESTSYRNELIDQSMQAEPVAIDELLTADNAVTAGAGFAPEDEWRRVIATGSYLPDKEVLVRLRLVRQLPAYEVITPFQLTDGPIVLVNRGYVLPEEGTAPPPFDPPPTGQVELDAHVRQAEGTSRQPIEDAGYVQVYNIDPEQIGSAVDVNAADGYLQLEEGQPGGLGLIELPQTDSGPYLSYGLQWLAFGIMAPLGLAYFVRAELRERRKNNSSAPAVDNSDEVATSAATATTAPEFTLPTRRERKSSAQKTSAATSVNDVRLADRYGKKR